MRRRHPHFIPGYRRAFAPCYVAAMMYRLLRLWWWIKP